MKIAVKTEIGLNFNEKALPFVHFLTILNIVPGDRRHATLAKIMSNHDTWNACQDHGKIMVLSRFLSRVMSKIRLKPFSVNDRVPSS